MLDRALTFVDHSETEPDFSVLKSYEDYKQMSDATQASVARVIEAGIMQGVSDTEIAPNDHANRAQAVVMLKRFLEYVGFIE